MDPNTMSDNNIAEREVNNNRDLNANLGETSDASEIKTGTVVSDSVSTDEPKISQDEESEKPLETETIDITPEKSGGVMKQILKAGDGDEYPGYGDRVSVHYTGWLLNGSKEPMMFDSNRKGDRCEFNLGRGQVIKGWDLGLSTMKKGEVALFICQPDYAYGEMGNPPVIPPHTPLLFEVELYGWKLEDLSPRKDNGILRKVVEKGEGTTFPNEGSEVTVKILGYYKDNVFMDDEKTFYITEGYYANIPEGIELALLKFHLSEKSLIYLKSKYAFDNRGSSEYGIPPDADVHYEVTLLSFKKVKEVWEMNSDEKFEKASVSKGKGIAFFKLGQFRLALKQFRWIPVCLENEPGAPDDPEKARQKLLLSGYLNIALCFLKLENYIEVIKACDKALEIDPQNEKGLFRRGQARMLMNDCQEALQDFELLCKITPENKLVKNSIILCQEKIKKQNLKDKDTYNKMFEKFVKQDEERLRNIKTETGIWQSDKKEENKSSYMSETRRLLEQSNSALLDANIIELSNNVH